MDLIDRQTAIDALDRIFDRCEEIEVHLPKGDPDRTGYKMYPDYMTVWKYLRQLPSAQPERKKGNWILIADGYTDYVKCDQCGNISYVERNFCPECGTDMREEQEPTMEEYMYGQDMGNPEDGSL